MKFICKKAILIFFWKTSQHVNTRYLGQEMKGSPVGKQVAKCVDTAHIIDCVKFAASPGVEKLMKTKNVNINKMKPQLNTHD